MASIKMFHHFVSDEAGIVHIYMLNEHAPWPCQIPIRYLPPPLCEWQRRQQHMAADTIPDSESSSSNAPPASAVPEAPPPLFKTTIPGPILCPQCAQASGKRILDRPIDEHSAFHNIASRLCEDSVPCINKAAPVAPDAAVAPQSSINDPAPVSPVAPQPTMAQAAPIASDAAVGPQSLTTQTAPVAPDAAVAPDVTIPPQPTMAQVAPIAPDAAVAPQPSINEAFPVAPDAAIAPQPSINEAAPVAPDVAVALQPMTIQVPAALDAAVGLQSMMAHAVPIVPYSAVVPQLVTTQEVPIATIDPRLIMIQADPIAPDAAVAPQPMMTQAAETAATVTTPLEDGMVTAEERERRRKLNRDVLQKRHALLSFRSYKRDYINTRLSPLSRREGQSSDILEGVPGPSTGVTLSLDDPQEVNWQHLYSEPVWIRPPPAFNLPKADPKGKGKGKEREPSA
ncbi:hypothetical protein SCUCBS95973_002272 [Sporothrix curviconia]|uniref:BZIP domain-containing protein n=1 Tax=Sporothrix curviconia TaxID=1260050 RepID=A0ABP0B5U4_9PEZI